VAFPFKVSVTAPDITLANLTNGRVAIVGASGLITDSSGLTFSGGTLTSVNFAATTLVTTPALTLTGFTAGNIPFIGSSGVVTQSGSLAFNSGTGTLSVSTLAAGTAITAPSGTIDGLTTSYLAIATSGSAGIQIGTRDSTNQWFMYITGNVLHFNDFVADRVDFGLDGSVRANTFKPAVAAKTANATLTLLEDTIICDPTTASFTLTLPAVSGTSGKRYLVKKEGSTNNTVTLDANASETIDGALTFVLRDRQEVCEIVSNGTEWKKAGNYAGQAPVGAVFAWLKTYTNTPSLPTGWVECNGQTLSDTGSVYNGQVIPNLNNSGGAAANRFLRGATSSGGTGGSETHAHTITFSTTSVSVSGTGQTMVTGVTSPTGTASTLPSYYEVVWVMRVK
jgi:hypothetical protein